ncbi:MAG: KAP family NTPase [Marinisporobacter sp.]|nr:KAP family NTPase [Marinisporobacter sp.]
MDDKEEERYYDLFPSRRRQVDFVLTQLIGLGSERSFAFGITCPWGGGKTSFLNGVKDRIKKNGWSKNDFIQRGHLTENIAQKCEDLYKRNDKIKITEEDVIFVDYKPWFASGSKHVVAHFLDTLQKSLSPYDGELAGSIAKYRKLLLSLNPGVFKSFVDGSVDFFSVHKDIEDRFKNVERCIQRMNKKILVFMDDLDRLEANELVASLKIIRNTGSFKNVVFFVTYDKEYVLSQLASHFNFDKTDKKEGNRFLEKFFQLEIPLPQSYPSEVREYVIKKLKGSELLDLLINNNAYNGEDLTKVFHFNNEILVGFDIVNDLSKEKRNLSEKDKHIINGLNEPLDLMEELQIPRTWNKIINQIYLSSYSLKQGNFDYLQLFIMIVFKEKYPKEAYQIFCEISESKEDSFLKAKSNIPYTTNDENLKGFLSRKVYQLGNYDLNYMKYIGAFFFDINTKKIGFFRNYIHYYNLSFPPYSITEKEFNHLLGNPKEVQVNKNSNNENNRIKYLNFVKKLEVSDKSDYNLFNWLLIEMIVSEEDLFYQLNESSVQSKFPASLIYSRIALPFVKRIEVLIKGNNVYRLLKEIDYISLRSRLVFLNNILIRREYGRELKSKIEDAIEKFFPTMLNNIDESLFYLLTKIVKYEDSKDSLYFELMTQLNTFLEKGYSNLFQFLLKKHTNLYSQVDEPFSKLSIFKKEDPDFIKFINGKDSKEGKFVLLGYNKLIEANKKELVKD